LSHLGEFPSLAFPLYLAGLGFTKYNLEILTMIIYDYYECSRADVIKLFYGRKIRLLTISWNCDKPFQLSLLFAGKARSLT
jgi:hypothetical protein